MKFIALKKKLKEDIRSAYIIYGDDLYLKSAAINHIKDAFIEKGAEFNTLQFSTYNLNEENFKMVLNTDDFFSEKKIIIIKAEDKKRNIKIIEIIKSYLNNINKNVCLIMVDDEKNHYFEELKKDTETIDCNTLSRELLKKVIIKKLADKKMNIDNSAIEKFIDVASHNLSTIDMEIKKFSSLLSKNHTISISDIENNVFKNIDYKIYELTNALGNRSTELTFNILNNFKSERGVSYNLISVIGNHFIRLFNISISKKSNEEIAKDLGIKPYAVLKLREQADNFTQRKLREINGLLIDIDHNIKNGRYSSSYALEYIILYILNK